MGLLIDGETICANYPSTTLVEIEQPILYHFRPLKIEHLKKVYISIFNASVPASRAEARKKFIELFYEPGEAIPTKSENRGDEKRESDS